MLPSAGGASKAEEAALLQEAKSVATSRSIAEGGGRGNRGRGRDGQGRGANSGKAKDAAPESPTRGAVEPESAGAYPIASALSL